MTTLIIKYDTDTGSIENWKYDACDSPETGDNEIVVSQRGVNHRELAAKKVDVSTDPPELVDDPEHVVPEKLDRAKVTTDSKRMCREARQKRITAKSGSSLQTQIDALQTQLDELFEIITGEEP